MQRRHNSNCCGKALSRIISVQRESSENPKISVIPRETKIKVFPQGNYIAQSSIPKTSIISLYHVTNGIPKISTISLYYVTKGISEKHQLERELWLSEVLQKH